jgi:ubiquinone/menaquinone biosynthesis C-methylase UbiE
MTNNHKLPTLFKKEGTLDDSGLSERQAREREYHREHALKNDYLKSEPVTTEVTRTAHLRRWNAYWFAYSKILDENIENKKVLVVGSGFGEDVIRLSHMGAEVYGFDLSPDSIEISRERFEKFGKGKIDLRELPAESLNYEDRFFDLVFAVDILHHVEIPETMGELNRVAKSGGKFLFNEVYTHSYLDKVRNSKLVDKYLYPKMKKFVYGTNQPYITEDERKLNEKDVRDIYLKLKNPEEYYFNFLVNRIIPGKFDTLSKLDKSFLNITGKKLSSYMGARIVGMGEFD